MPQVLVTIGGRSYRLSCNPGEEEHLGKLAKFVDAKITEMHGAFRDIGDQRIVVMAALAIADELFEAKGRAEAAAGVTASLAQEKESRAVAEAEIARLKAAVAEAASRVEALTETLADPESEP